MRGRGSAGSNPYPIPTTSSGAWDELQIGSGLGAQPQLSKGEFYTTPDRTGRRQRSSTLESSSDGSKYSYPGTIVSKLPSSAATSVSPWGSRLFNHSQNSPKQRSKESWGGESSFSEYDFEHQHHHPLSSSLTKSSRAGRTSGDATDGGITQDTHDTPGAGGGCSASSTTFFRPPSRTRISNKKAAPGQHVREAPKPSSSSVLRKSLVVVADEHNVENKPRQEQALLLPNRSCVQRPKPAQALERVEKMDSRALVGVLLQVFDQWALFLEEELGLAPSPKGAAVGGVLGSLGRMASFGSGVPEAEGTSASSDQVADHLLENHEFDDVLPLQFDSHAFLASPAEYLQKWKTLGSADSGVREQGPGWTPGACAEPKTMGDLLRGNRDLLDLVPGAVVEHVLLVFDVLTQRLQGDWSAREAVCESGLVRYLVYALKMKLRSVTDLLRRCNSPTKDDEKLENDEHEEANSDGLHTQTARMAAEGDEQEEQLRLRISRNSQLTAPDAHEAASSTAPTNRLSGSSFKFSDLYKLDDSTPTGEGLDESSSEHAGELHHLHKQSFLMDSIPMDLEQDPSCQNAAELQQQPRKVLLDGQKSCANRDEAAGASRSRKSSVWSDDLMAAFGVAGSSSSAGGPHLNTAFDDDEHEEGGFCGVNRMIHEYLEEYAESATVCYGLLKECDYVLAPVRNLFLVEKILMFFNEFFRELTIFSDTAYLPAKCVADLLGLVASKTMPWNQNLLGRASSTSVGNGFGYDMIEGFRAIGGAPTADAAMVAATQRMVTTTRDDEAVAGGEGAAATSSSSSRSGSENGGSIAAPSSGTSMSAGGADHRLLPSVAGAAGAPTSSGDVSSAASKTQTHDPQANIQAATVDTSSRVRSRSNKRKTYRAQCRHLPIMNGLDVFVEYLASNDISENAAAATGADSPSLVATKMGDSKQKYVGAGTTTSAAGGASGAAAASSSTSANDAASSSSAARPRASSSQHQHLEYLSSVNKTASACSNKTASTSASSNSNYVVNGRGSGRCMEKGSAASSSKSKRWTPAIGGSNAAGSSRSRNRVQMQLQLSNDDVTMGGLFNGNKMSNSLAGRASASGCSSSLSSEIRFLDQDGTVENPFEQRKLCVPFFSSDELLTSTWESCLLTVSALIMMLLDRGTLAFTSSSSYSQADFFSLSGGGAPTAVGAVGTAPAGGGPVAEDLMGGHFDPLGRGDAQYAALLGALTRATAAGQPRAGTARAGDARPAPADGQPQQAAGDENPPPLNIPAPRDVLEQEIEQLMRTYQTAAQRNRQLLRRNTSTMDSPMNNYVRVNPAEWYLTGFNDYAQPVDPAEWPAPPGNDQQNWPEGAGAGIQADAGVAQQNQAAGGGAGVTPSATRTAGTTGVRGPQAAAGAATAGTTSTQLSGSGGATVDGAQDDNAGSRANGENQDGNAAAGDRAARRARLRNLLSAPLTPGVPLSMQPGVLGSAGVAAAFHAAAATAGTGTARSRNNAVEHVSLSSAASSSSSSSSSSGAADASTARGHAPAPAAPAVSIAAPPAAPAANSGGTTAGDFLAQSDLSATMQHFDGDESLVQTLLNVEALERTTSLFANRGVEEAVSDYTDSLVATRANGVLDWDGSTAELPLPPLPEGVDVVGAPGGGESEATDRDERREITGPPLASSAAGGALSTLSSSSVSGGEQEGAAASGSDPLGATTTNGVNLPAEVVERFSDAVLATSGALLGLEGAAARDPERRLRRRRSLQRYHSVGSEPSPALAVAPSPLLQNPGQLSVQLTEIQELEERIRRAHLETRGRSSTRSAGTAGGVVSANAIRSAGAGASSGIPPAPGPDQIQVAASVPSRNIAAAASSNRVQGGEGAVMNSLPTEDARSRLLGPTLSVQQALDYASSMERLAERAAANNWDSGSTDHEDQNEDGQEDAAAGAALQLPIPSAASLLSEPQGGADAARTPSGDPLTGASAGSSGSHTFDASAVASQIAAGANGGSEEEQTAASSPPRSSSSTTAPTVAPSTTRTFDDSRQPEARRRVDEEMHQRNRALRRVARRLSRREGAARDAWQTVGEGSAGAANVSALGSDENPMNPNASTRSGRGARAAAPPSENAAAASADTSFAAPPQQTGGAAAATTTGATRTPANTDLASIFANLPWQAIQPPPWPAPGVVNVENGLREFDPAALADHQQMLFELGLTTGTPPELVLQQGVGNAGQQQQIPIPPAAPATRRREPAAFLGGPWPGVAAGGQPTIPPIFGAPAAPAGGAPGAGGTVVPGGNNPVAAGYLAEQNARFNIPGNRNLNLVQALDRAAAIHAAGGGLPLAGGNNNAPGARAAGGPATANTNPEITPLRPQPGLFAQTLNAGTFSSVTDVLQRAISGYAEHINQLKNNGVAVVPPPRPILPKKLPASSPGDSSITAANANANAQAQPPKPIAPSGELNLPLILQCSQLAAFLSCPRLIYADRPNLTQPFCRAVSAAHKPQICENLFQTLQALMDYALEGTSGGAAAQNTALIAGNTEAEDPFLDAETASENQSPKRVPRRIGGGGGLRGPSIEIVSRCVTKSPKVADRTIRRSKRERGGTNVVNTAGTATSRAAASKQSRQGGALGAVSDEFHDEQIELESEVSAQLASAWMLIVECLGNVCTEQGGTVTKGTLLPDAYSLRLLKVIVSVIRDGYQSNASFVKSLGPKLGQRVAHFGAALLVEYLRNAMLLPVTMHQNRPGKVQVKVLPPERRPQGLAKPDPMLAKLFEDGCWADFSIIAGDGDEKQEFRVHRCVLYAYVPYFRGMFGPSPAYVPDSGLQRTTSQFAESMQVNFPDIPPPLMRTWIQYVYSFDTDLINSVEIASDLLRLADRFCQAILLRDCEMYLFDHLHAANVDTFLDLSVRCNANALLDVTSELALKLLPDKLQHNTIGVWWLRGHAMLTAEANCAPGFGEPGHHVASADNANAAAPHPLAAMAGVAGPAAGRSASGSGGANAAPSSGSSAASANRSAANPTAIDANGVLTFDLPDNSTTRPSASSGRNVAGDESGKQLSNSLLAGTRSSEQESEVVRMSGASSIHASVSLHRDATADDDNQMEIIEENTDSEDGEDEERRLDAKMPLLAKAMPHLDLVLDRADHVIQVGFGASSSSSAAAGEGEQGTVIESAAATATATQT